jgi:hypothetical protein
MDMDAALDCLARRQHALLTTSQLQHAGYSKRAIYLACKNEALFAVRHGVYRPAGAPITQQMAWMAAVLGAGSGSVLSHLSAAQAYGFRWFTRPDSIHLVAETPTQPRMTGVVAHRTISLPDYDLTHLRSIPTTTPERTFIDVCGSVPYKTLGESGDDLLRRNVLRLPRLVRSFDLIPASGRRKRRPMYGFFEERVAGYDPGGSDRELDVMKLIKGAGDGLVVPEQQYRVVVEGHKYYLDYAWPHTLNGLEWDSYEYHGRMVSDFHRGKDRTRRLQRAGWTIWSVTARTSANEILAIAAAASVQKVAA